MDRDFERNIRNATILLLAADTCLSDDLGISNALKFAYGLERALSEESWANGKHSGDCTKQPHSCARCQVEAAEARARAMFEEE